MTESSEPLTADEESSGYCETQAYYGYSCGLVIAQAATIAALRTQLEQAQGNFQRETLRTSELSVILREVVENLCPQHGPGSYGRHGCRYCGLLLEIEQLLVKPINAQQADIEEAQQMRERRGEWMDEHD